MRTNPIRFAGLASGMDTDRIVKDMLMPQQFNIQNQKKEQMLIKLRQDAWRDMNTKLYDFHTNIAQKMTFKSSFSNSKAYSSNEGSVSLTPGQIIPEGTHRFEVLALATSTSASGEITNGNSLGSDTTVGDLVGGSLEETVNISMTVNNRSFSLEVGKGTTLKDLSSKMNTEFKSLGSSFKANYDSDNGMFFINASKLGDGETISFNKGSSDNLFDKLGFTENGLEKDGVVNTGEKASYKYNGVPLFSDTNSVSVNGINVTLKAKSIGSEVVTISSEVDLDAAYNFVKEFVTEYNKLINDINDKLGTRPANDLKPLTSDEKKDMSEGHIKLWEDRINKSLFYKDPQLEQFVNTSRAALNKSIGAGPYNSLASIGIVTGKWEEKGALHILGDKDDLSYSSMDNKLKQALSENPEEIIDLLTNIGTEFYQAHRDALKSTSLKSALNFYNDKSLDKQLKGYDKQISSLEDKMYRMEQVYFAKFAAMEQMISSLNSQGSWLSQQFGGY